MTTKHQPYPPATVKLQRGHMEAAFFKLAFFVLMGLAILSLLAIATTFVVVTLKALWSWLRIHVRVAKTGHA
jgi:hypothetical protein